LRRLSPSWSTSAPAAAPTATEEPLRRRDPAVSVGASAWFVLMPEEADQTIPPREDLEQFLGAGIQREVAFEFDDSLGERTVAALAEIRDHEAPVAILLPTTRDPIDEVCDTLKGIEEAVGNRTSLIVLRGTPERLALWKHKLGIWGIGLPVEYIALP
jgi:hypothetical protein